MWHRPETFSGRIAKSSARLFVRALSCPLSRIVVNGIGRLGSRDSIRGRLASLEGKSVRVEFADLGKTLCVKINNGRIRWADPKAPANATIRGSFDDLWAILSGESDADGLFFARRLAVEGEGHAAMAAKNVMESLVD